MQMSAASFSGMKIGPKDATSVFFTNRSLHVFDRSLKAPVKVVSRNQRGVLGAASWAATAATKDTSTSILVILLGVSREFDVP